MENINTFEVSDGVSLSCIKSDKFKNAQISFTFFYPLEEKLVSAFSLMISVLSDSCAKFDDFRKLNKYLEETYGACIDYDIFKVGNYHAVSLSVCALDDKFTIENGENTSKMVDLICELIFNPLTHGNKFDENVVARRKEEIIELINAEILDKRTWSIIRCKQEMFKGDRCGIPKYGTISDVENLDSELLFAIYKNYLRRARVKIVMVSSSDCDAVVEKIKSKFSSIDRAPNFEFESVQNKVPKSVNEVLEKMNVQQCKLVMGFRTPFIAPADTHAMTLASAIYGGVPTSKLFMNVRERLNLCYYCSSNFDSSTGILYVDSGIEEKNIETARTEIMNQMNLMKGGKISDEELDEAKQFLIQGAEKISDNISRICDWYTLRFPINVHESPEEFSQKIENITKDEIANCMSSVNLDTFYTLVKGE